MNHRQENNSNFVTLKIYKKIRTLKLTIILSLFIKGIETYSVFKVNHYKQLDFTLIFFNDCNAQALYFKYPELKISNIE